MSSFGFEGFTAAMADVKSTSVSGKSPSVGGTGGGSPPPPSPYSSSCDIIPGIWSSELCGGRIGTGDFVCCLSRADCRVASHRSRPAGIEVGTLYVPDIGNTRFHKDYCLVLEDYPALVRAELCQARPGREHRRLLDLVKRSNASDLDDLDSETLAEFFQSETARWAPATPGVIQKTVKKPRQFLARLEGVKEEISEVQSLLSVFEKAVLRITDPLSPGSETPELFLASQTPKLRAAFEATEKLVKALYGVVNNNKESIEESMVNVFGRLEGNLSEVYAAIGDVDKQESLIQPFGFDLASAVGGLAVGLREVQVELCLGGDEDAPCSKRVKLSDAIESAAGRVSKIEATLHGDVIAGFNFLIPEVKRLQVLVAARTSQDQERSDGVLPGQEMGGNFEKLTSEMLYELGSLRASVAALEVQKTPIPNATEYTLAGQTFSTLDEVKLFLASGGEMGNDPGFYFDCFSVGTLSALKDKTMDETMKMKALTQSSGLPESVNACAVLLSFGCDRPSIVGVSSENVSRDIPLPRVRSFEDWYHPSLVSKTIMSRYDSTHEILEKHLAGFADMQRIQPKLKPLVALAREMLSNCKKFIQELSRQVENFRNMVLAESCTPEEAWLLIAEMLSAVFAEINKARTPFGDSIVDHADKNHRCSLALIGTFRAHAKMEEIWKASFTKHPCVSTCMSLHLFREKASTNRILAAEAKVEDLEGKFKAFQKSVQSQLDQLKRGGEAKGGAAKKAAA